MHVQIKRFDCSRQREKALRRVLLFMYEWGETEWVSDRAAGVLCGDVKHSALMKEQSEIHGQRVKRRLWLAGQRE